MMNGKIYTRRETNYVTIDAVNFSTLKYLRKSPKHYRHWLTHGRVPTEPMKLGVAAHMAVLEPERFLLEYALWDEKTEKGRTRPRAGKDWEAFQAVHTGKQIIRIEEYELAIRLRDTIRADRIAMRYLATGQPEAILEWEDEESGLRCKGRADWIADVGDTQVLVDLKSTRDADPAFFYRQCASLDYHMQLAYYADGYERITGKEPRVVVIAVETVPPYDVVVDIVPPEVLDVGRNEYRDLLLQLSECREKDFWPGYGRDMERVFQLPHWRMPQEDTDTNGMGLDWSKNNE